MSSKKEEKRVSVPRCLVITFKELSDKNTSTEDKAERLGHFSTSKSEELFEEFVSLNKLCYWDAHIRESFCGLCYYGCVKLHSSSRSLTVLCTAKDIFLDTIKKAWSKKVLHSPEKYQLYKIGEYIVYAKIFLYL